VIQVLIVDDHSIVRKGLKQIIAESPGLAVGGEADNGQSALDLARTRHFDVAIVDISMPGRGGLDLLKDLRLEMPELKIIILSMHAEEQYAIRCLRDGASAYITKECATDELVNAIHTVARGKRYITPSLVERLAAYIGTDSDRLPHEGLSDREMQVFSLVVAGISMGDIAGKLNLSVKTVSTYRKRILEKMGMENNSQLIRYALEHKLN
jgi:two-component system, NarL family, invasion response regulator UvrY